MNSVLLLLVIGASYLHITFSTICSVILFSACSTLLTPKRSFGNKTVVRRSFQPSWYDSFSRLHYDESRDVAYCYVCMRASKEKLAAKCTDQAFISTGFHNWKDATVSFNKHEKTGCHKDAIQMMVFIPKCYKDCGEMLSSEHAKEKAENQQILYKILTNVRYLAREGLPLRGDGTEDDSNYTH